MNILVTGCSGYIGGAMVHMLNQTNINVFGIDIVNPPYHVERNLTRFHLGSYEGCGNFIDMHKIDYIIHMAAYTKVADSIDNPAAYYYNNVVKFDELLKVAKDKVKGIILVSSAAVYEGDCLRLDENSKLKPNNPYGTTKLINELQLQNSGIKHIILRYFNVCDIYSWPIHGPVLKPEPTHLIPKAVLYSILNKELTIYGNSNNTPDGSCIRDYVSVNDVTAATFKALQILDLNSYIVNEPINIGCGVGRSNHEIASLVSRYTTNGLKVNVQESNRPGDVPYLIADTYNMRTKLDYNLEYTDMSEIIKRTEEWFRDRL